MCGRFRCERVLLSLDCATPRKWSFATSRLDSGVQATLAAGRVPNAESGSRPRALVLMTSSGADARRHLDFRLQRISAWRPRASPVGAWTCSDVRLAALRWGVERAPRSRVGSLAHLAPEPGESARHVLR
jgi:hypothetical protein